MGKSIFRSFHNRLEMTPAQLAAIRTLATILGHRPSMALIKACTGVTETCQADGGECMICSVRDCPDHEPLHYHHDGCPCCDGHAKGPLVDPNLTVTYLDEPECPRCGAPSSEKDTYCQSCSDEVTKDARPCMDAEDEAYERAAARARSNDFEETGGKDWT